MEVFARLIELKPGTDQRVREWAEYINEHRADANSTLRNERVEVESWFDVTLDGKRYLPCYMRAASLEEARATAEHSSSAVDAYHRQSKIDTWVRGGGAVGRLLVDPAGSG